MLLVAAFTSRVSSLFVSQIHIQCGSQLHQVSWSLTQAERSVMTQKLPEHKYRYHRVRVRVRVRLCLAWHQQILAKLFAFHPRTQTNSK